MRSKQAGSEILAGACVNVEAKAHRYVRVAEAKAHSANGARCACKFFYEDTEAKAHRNVYLLRQRLAAQTV